MPSAPGKQLDGLLKAGDEWLVIESATIVYKLLNRSLNTLELS